MAKYLWKSLSAGLNSYHGQKKWKIGKWYKCRGELEMCNKGFHASERIIDSMQYVPLECLAKVEVRGKHIDYDDKQCWQGMKIIQAWEWTQKDSVALSVYAAELVIKNFETRHPSDKRPRNAIEAARAWLKNPTKINRSTAKSAAESARSAARSAESAARSAKSAAWSAARSAESAARSAAYEEILNKCEKWIRARVQKLDEQRD